MPQIASSRAGRVKQIGMVLGFAALGAVILSEPPAGMSTAAWHTAGVALMMAAWWMTEAVPVAVTGLLPIVAFPPLGVAEIGDATAPYASPLVFLFLGGFMIALAMERCNLHRRIALNIIGFVGSHPHAIVLGFMIATALLSMWISNTATTMMMLPIAMSVAGLLVTQTAQRADKGANEGADNQDVTRFGLCLMLGIAYSASVGGVGTLIGTPTNAAMANILSIQFGVEIGFAQWTLLGIPFVLVMLPLTWFALTRLIYPFDLGHSEDAATLIRAERAALGTMSAAERRVASIAGLVATLWITRGVTPGIIEGVSDTGIAMFGAILLFLVPSGAQAGARPRDALLNWEIVVKLPWAIILLFGGGLSLARGMSTSGLAGWISDGLTVLGTWPTVLLIACIVAVIIYLTELTSNVATTSAFVPVIGALALGLGLDPILLAAPVAMAASCAFMLPVATPPNAIVFGSGLVSIPQMVRAGLWLNLLSIAVVTAFAVLLLPLVFA